MGRRASRPPHFRGEGYGSALRPGGRGRRNAAVVPAPRGRHRHSDLAQGSTGRAGECAAAHAAVLCVLRACHTAWRRARTSVPGSSSSSALLGHVSKAIGGYLRCTAGAVPEGHRPQWRVRSGAQRPSLIAEH